MTKYLKTILAGVFFATVAVAAPSINGPTGLITIPTAESLQLKEFNFAADYLWGNSSKSESWRIKANMGTFQNFEVGVIGGKVPTEGAYVNVKYYLLSDREKYPLALAVGAENLFSRSKTDLYMVASKAFALPIRVHFGFKATFTDTELLPSVMGGFEYLVSTPVSFLADISGQGKKYMVNAGVRWAIVEECLLQAALLDLGRTDPNSANVMFSVTLSKFM